MKRPWDLQIRCGCVVLVSALLLLCLPHPASAQFAPAWQRNYLRGMRLERNGRYGPALEAFGFARTLQPNPRKDVRFPGGRRLPYDPYYHMAYCLARTGGSPLVIKKLAQRSVQAKVTPMRKLEELRDYVLSHNLAAPWARRTHPPGKPAAPRVTPSPQPSPTPVRARLDLTAAPAGVTVEVDGHPWGSGHTSLMVPPGRHHLRLMHGHRVLYDRWLNLAPGETLAVVLPTIAPRPRTTPTPTLTPSPKPSPSPPPAAVGGAVPASAPAGGTFRTAAFKKLSGRAGAAFALALLVLLILGIAAVLIWRGKRRNPDLSAERTRRLASPPGGLTGYTFGPYEIEAKLGSGGMATTYRARRRSDGKEVALKIPHDTCLEDETFRKRFLREGALGAQLHHPNLVRIIEAGEDHGMPFIAMELVRGVTLRDLLAVAGQLPLDRALDLTRQTAEALDYAHSKGVIHRDLKPENLMVLPDDRLMVMDFGIARVEGGSGLTSTSVVMGTPAYTAPESLAREPVDHRADLYALGIILYEMLEGQGPLPGANPLEQLQAHLKGVFPKRSELVRPLPDPVWDLIGRLVARNPDDRFPSAEALLVELGGIIRDLEEGRLSPA